MYIGTIDEMVHENAIFVLKLDRELKLYTHPKEWQGLSDYEIFKTEGLDCVDEEYIKRFARAIEAKLKEKNNE